MQIELLKPHEHAGQRLNAGAVLSIDDTQGQWLIDLEVARLVSPPSAFSAHSPSKPGKPNSSSMPSNPLSLNPPSKPTEEISK